MCYLITRAIRYILRYSVESVYPMEALPCGQGVDLLGRCRVICEQVLNIHIMPYVGGYSSNPLPISPLPMPKRRNRCILMLLYIAGLRHTTLYANLSHDKVRCYQNSVYETCSSSPSLPVSHGWHYAFAVPSRWSNLFCSVSRCTSSPLLHPGHHL